MTGGARPRLTRAIPALILGMWSGVVGSEAMSEYELKAAYLYQFAQFVTWPDLPADPFRICIYGTNPFGDRLVELKGKAVNQRPVDIGFPATIQEAKDCRVVFLNPRTSGELASAARALNDLPILTVSDMPGAWGDEVKIVLNTEPNRVSFRINLTSSRRAGLDMSSRLLKLAREIK